MTARAALEELAKGVLTVVLACTLLGDFLGSHAPIVMSDRDGLHVLPRLTAPALVQGRSPTQIAAALGTNGWALWPLVVALPATATTDPGGATTVPEALGAAPLFVGWLRATQSSVALATLVVSLSLLVGSLLGSVAALGPPIADALLSRLVELVSTLPTVLVVALLAAALRSTTLLPLVVALSAAQSAELARLVRVRVLQLRTADFGLSSRALGAAPWQLLRAHFLPQLVPSLKVAATLAVASTVGVEAALGALGVGAVPGHTSWGVVLGAAGGGVPKSLLWMVLLSTLAALSCLHLLRTAPGAARAAQAAPTGGGDLAE